MAHCLRPRADGRKNYAELNDLPTEIIRTLSRRQKKLRWSANDSFEIKILNRVGNDHVSVHFNGYGSEYDQVMLRSELIVKSCPSAVDGPTNLLAFCETLRRKITKEPKSPNHAMPNKEIRIETSESVLADLRKALATDFVGQTTVNQWTTLLGHNFNQRYLNADGDYCQISADLIRCRVKTPPPENVFLPVPEGFLMEHQFANNPVFILCFTLQKKPSAVQL